MKNFKKFRKKTDYEKVSSAPARDVYRNQQLDRSKLSSTPKKTYQMVALASFVILLVVFYILVTAITFGISRTKYQMDISTAKLSKEYVGKTDEGNLGINTKYFVADEEGNPMTDARYDSEMDVPEPDWHKEKIENAKANAPTLASTFKKPLSSQWRQIAAVFFMSLVIESLIYTVLMRKWEAQTAESRTDDINQYDNDQHITLPEELFEDYDVFPDAGAHSSVSVSTLISHAAMENKGVNQTKIAKRYKEDVLDENGEVLHFEGELIRDDNDEIVEEKVPMFDKKFGEALFKTSGAEEMYWKCWNPSKIASNPKGKNREKFGKFDTISDLINNDWVLPFYEPQRPSGVYLVDGSPVNTMVLAITRAGKGQTVIEPTVDMWTRQKWQDNIVINDPKGELLRKFYVPATVRGYEVLQFNLINPMKTDIFNPLGMAAEAARTGNSVKCAQYIENIATIFFPVDGGDDPVWANSANNAFKRICYGMIDYYLEEEKVLRYEARVRGWSDRLLMARLDSMWAKVTLYNCYQMFVQLSSKVEKNPQNVLAEKAKKEEVITDEERQYAEKKAEFFDGKPQMDLLSLYFAATEKLPMNSTRTLAMNTHNALKSMGSAEKMLSSVYSISITAMSYFTDPTIQSLTSGSPSQNVDLAGFSFPRRLGVRFHSTYLSRYKFAGMQAKWDAFSDSAFKESLGKDFEHEDLVDRIGWAKYYFKGIFPKNVAYVRLRIINPNNDMILKTFYFKFTKTYKTSLDAKRYIRNPVTDEKMVRDGVLTELKRVRKKTKDKNGKEIVREKFVERKSTFKDTKLDTTSIDDVKMVKVDIPVFINHMTNYSEKSKISFMVTPPHLTKYAKLLLILIKQLVDINFEQSYLTKESQKPLYATRYMLDELGNLKSEGQGIQDFGTMLSIGLGQSQYFTLILQTLQQLKDLYGDSMDKIIQGNVANIVFLKSTDDEMIQTLEKQSGTTHRAYRDGKSVQRNLEKIAMKNQGTVSYQTSLKEEPVIRYNDMAYIDPRNSIIFRAGASPIWNRNEMILPMSWRLLQNTIKVPGKEYSLQTIPTTSSVLEFDVRKNQPNFVEILEKRIEQAMHAEEMKEQYQSSFGYSDYQVEQLDPDLYADEIMEMINQACGLMDFSTNEEPPEFDGEMFMHEPKVKASYADNDLYYEAESKIKADEMQNEVRRYADNQLSRSDIVHSGSGEIHGRWDSEVIAAYLETRESFKDKMFVLRNGELYGSNGDPYIVRQHNSVKPLNEAAKDPSKRTYGDGELEDGDLTERSQWHVTDAFYRFLVSCDQWDFANGRFDFVFAQKLRQNT